MSWRTKLLTAAIGLGVALSIGLSAAPAEARFFGGFGFGYPGFYRPYYRPYPVFYRPYIPPPYYVEPRPAYYVPATAGNLSLSLSAARGSAASQGDGPPQLHLPGSG